MTTPLEPGWAEKPKEEPRRSFRTSDSAIQASRLRGNRRALASRYALKDWLQFDPENPEVFE